MGYALADLIVRLLVAPLSALAAAVMYFELKALHSEPVAGDAGRARRRRPRQRRAPRPRPGLTCLRSAAGGAGGFDQEARRESPPDLVLPIDALFARGADALGVERRSWTASEFSHPSSQLNRFSRVTSAWNCSPHAGFPSMRNA